MSTPRVQPRAQPPVNNDSASALTRALSQYNCVYTKTGEARHQPDPRIAQANAAAAEAVVYAMCLAGVEHAVVSPGSRNTPVLLALQANSAIDVTVVLDERTAGFYALGLARTGTKPVVLVCTSGSAGAHYAAAIAEANHSRLPLIAITADRPARLHNCGAPQTMAQAQLFAGQTRGFCQLEAPTASTNPDQWLAHSHKLFAQATSVHPGPVHLNLRFAKPLWSHKPRSPYTPTARPEPLPSSPHTGVLEPKLVSTLATSLGGVTRGAIVCGPQLGADNPALARAIEKLATQLGWPLVGEPLMGCVGSTPAPQIAYADLFLRTPQVQQELAPELVLRFGAMPTSKFVGQWLEAHARGRTLLVDPAAQWLDPTKGVDTLISAEPVELCRQLCRQLPPSQSASRDYLNVFRARDQQTARVVQARDSLWWEGSISRTIAQTLAPGTPVHIGNSNAVRDLGSFAQAQANGLRVLGSRGVNGIDGNVATALGEMQAAKARGVLVCGDLTLRHDLGTLLNATGELPTDLTVVVIQNGGGGIFRQLPISSHPVAFEKFFLTPRQSVLSGFCQAAHITYRHVRNHRELVDSLVDTTSPGTNGLCVIEVEVDGAASENTRRQLLGELATTLTAPGPQADLP